MGPNARLWSGSRLADNFEIHVYSQYVGDLDHLAANSESSRSSSPPPETSRAGMIAH